MQKIGERGGEQFYATYLRQSAAIRGRKLFLDLPFLVVGIANKDRFVVQVQRVSCGEAAGHRNDVGNVYGADRARRAVQVQIA